MPNYRTLPSALAARLPPSSPRNQRQRAVRFALRCGAEWIGLDWIGACRSRWATAVAHRRFGPPAHACRVCVDAFGRSRRPTPSLSLGTGLRHPEQPESRRRCVRAASTLQYSGAVMRLGRPCLEAVQVAPTPRIRPREVQRYCEAHDLHDASMSRPSKLKLALVAYWYGPAVKVVAKSSIFGWVTACPDARP